MTNKLKAQGALTNGGRYIHRINQEGSEPTMFFFILRKNATSDIRDLIEREMQRHLEAFHGTSKTLSSRVQWIGNDLILATDNTELFEEWWSIERGYVEYMLDLDAANDEEVAVPDDHSENWPLNPAA